jgi:GR25 family glycosyltransferase involved in LPS biosynthesis
MRVGITFNPNTQLYYSGANQTAHLLAELCRILGYDVVMVDYTNSEIAMVEQLYRIRDLDLLLDIDGVTSESARQPAAKKTVVFLRTFLQFAELDAQLYIESPYVPRSMKWVSEIWCWDVLNPVETIPSIQTMFPCPIVRVPFIWSYSSVMNNPSDVYTFIPENTFTVHIAEKNTDNSSSSILPIVAIRELHRTHSCVYKVHNMEQLKENKFLKENVLQTIQFDTLPASFAEKAPFHQWMQNDIILSHSRFTPLRIGLLTAIWLQIPLVHNSPFLRDFHPSLQETYYEGNSIQGISHALSKAMHHYSPCDRSAFESISPRAKRDQWSHIFDSLFSRKQTIVSPLSFNQPLIIAFDDMWPGFNYDTNFIMDALRHEEPTRVFKGMLYASTVKPHLLIFGPYSEGWKKVTDVPKVYFSGENWQHPTDPSISLYLSSASVEDGLHMRVPTWMHFIDWYSNAKEVPMNQEDNPIRMPLHFAMTSHPIPYDKREKFCAFVVSNPICPIRNDAFRRLNQYKAVSSGGAYENNIGGQLHLKYPGGGCGDISKHHFFAAHKFTISFENSQSPGYLTEKLLHAKMAGCVPLYWGDVTTDFNPNSFINLSNMGSAESIVDIVKKVESHPEMCVQIASTPPLDESRKQIALQTLSAMSKRLIQLATEPVSFLPKTVIDATYLINLDVRKDRLDTFITAHPTMKFTRISAVYGKKLQMSDTLYDLCKHNLFQWKKSVIACALSHISVWNTIVQNNATYTLVVEDDVRLVPGWNEKVNDIPQDADLLYLGGVLPANRHMLPSVLERVNEYWSRITPNTCFTKEPSPQFHFCAYSYILTKRGAQKLLDYLMYSNDKVCIPVDHLIGHPVIGLTKYVANQLLSGCFQEEDAEYTQAQFNELLTEKKFDSDIYNYTECFDVSTYHKNIKTENMTVYYMAEKPELYEQTWLQDMFQRTFEWKPVTAYKEPGWCLVQRPYLDQWVEFMTDCETKRIPFYALHVSDEFASDPINWYTYSMCKKVVRNYIRADLPLSEEERSKISVIPLGYHHKATTSLSIQDRKLVWSFHGTDWFDRATQLRACTPYTPHHCKLVSSWNDPNKTKANEYMMHLGNSRFCPIVRGNNQETFRIYEALEAGTLPIAMEPNEYTKWIDLYLHLSDLYDWTNPATMGTTISEQVQQEVINRWISWKEQVQIVLKSSV